MKRNYPSLIALGIIVTVVLGCGGLKNALPREGQYFEGDAASVAAQAIKDEVGKPFKTLEVFIDDNEFRVKVQNPDNPRNVDEYKYVAGFVTGPTPVQLSGIYDADKSGVPFDEIDFSAIPRFCDEALERANIEGGKIYRLTFQRGFAITDGGNAGALGNARWSIEIDGTREDVTAAADAKGNLLGVDLSRTARAADYNLLDEKELQKAQEMVKKMLGARDEIIEITFYDKFFIFKVPNAENPQVSDDYKYDINGITRSGLVKSSVMRMRDMENFSVHDVDFANAARFFAKAKERVAFPNASLGSMSVRRRSSSFDDKGFRTQWHVSLKSGVNEASVNYDNDGNEMSVRKNGQTISEEK